MFLFGVGYAGQRIATAAARACGGDVYTQSECRKAAARLTFMLDPIGTGLGMVHEHAKLAAQTGSETGRRIDAALTTASDLDRATGGLMDGFDRKAD